MSEMKYGVSKIFKWDKFNWANEFVPKRKMVKKKPINKKLAYEEAYFRGMVEKLKVLYGDVIVEKFPKLFYVEGCNRITFYHDDIGKSVALFSLSGSRILSFRSCFLDRSRSVYGLEFRKGFRIYCPTPDRVVTLVGNFLAPFNLRVKD